MGPFLLAVEQGPHGPNEGPHGPEMGRFMTLEDTKAREDGTEVEKAAGAATEAQSGTDWKAEARKWEQRAKENKAAADELAALKAEQMTEAEKAAAHLAEVEGELAALRAETQRQADAAEVAKATGTPAALLAYCKDRESMEAFAVEYAAAGQQPKGAAPAAPASRIATGAGAKAKASDVFAAYAQDVFTNRSL